MLRTKLLPPRPVSEFLSRPRLTEKLNANIDLPVTMVAADAGCGKTTLISDFIRSQSRHSVWYQLDHTDADPFVFLGYVAHGIKSFAPDFGEHLLPYLSEATDELLRFPERGVDLLINEIMETIDQPFILVLDDYHHIGRETVVHKLVDRLLQYSTELLHLIITTRDLPPLAIMRRRSQSRALLITRDELLFTDDEMRALFRQTLGVELEENELAEYRERTHGWITALQLVRQVAEQENLSGSTRPDLGSLLNRSEKDIFDYFAEEVFSHETAETQDLLMHLSLLESLPLDVCSRLFPAARCSAVLPELLNKNVFLTVAGDAGDAEVYRLHPLFRGFLQRRLRSEIGRAELEKERLRLAEFFLADNQWDSAVPLLLEAEDHDRAARIIAENGAQWLQSGAITTLDNFISEVPTKSLAKYPLSLLHKGEIARLRGETGKATSSLNRAVELLAKAGDLAGEAEALHSLASVARRDGNITAALNYLEKAEDLVGEGTETYLKCANTRGLCLVAQGAWTQAEHQFRVALELAEKRGNAHFIRLITHNIALPAGLRGDFGEALRWFKLIFPDERSRNPFPQEAIGYLNMARLHIFCGELDEGEKHLENAMEICQLYNLRSLVGEVYEAYGNLYREKDDFPRAAEFYERARAVYDETGVNIATRDLDEDRAKFLLIRGDAAKAKGLLEKLAEARAGSNNELAENTVSLALCRVRLVLGETDGLVDTVTSLNSFFREHNLNYDEANGCVLLAAALLADGRRKEMLEPLQRALDLTARFDYEHWMRREVRLYPHLFADEEVLERLPADLREELGAKVTAKPAPAAVSEIAAPIVDLTIKVLGPTEIHRDPAKPFAPDAWTTRRSRDIFCYVATSKHRRVAKDLLIEVFWGDEDLATIEKNFHPTISHIRKALNSRQTVKQNYLVFRDGSYQLNPEYTYSIDAEDFINFVTSAETAKRDGDTAALRTNLEAAYKLYRGDYVDGSYENWAEEQRHFYSEQYARVLNGLAKLSVTEKRWTDALKYATQVLAIDAYREDLHRLVLKVLAAQSKPAAVKKHYEDMQALLKQELGIEPAPETRKLFQELMK